MPVGYHQPKKQKGLNGPVRSPHRPISSLQLPGWYCFVIGNLCTENTILFPPITAPVTHALLNCRGITSVSPFSAETFPISPLSLAVLPLTFEQLVSLLSLFFFSRLDSI